MPDRTKTGNPVLDAWIDAVTPVAATAANAMPTPVFWEGMFFGKPSPAPTGGFPDAFFATSPLTELWNDVAQRSLGVMAALGRSAKAGDPFGEALEQSFGVFGDVGGAAAEGPALLAEAIEATTVLAAAREAYRAFMLTTWQHAFEEVMREAVNRADEGKPVVSPAQWLSLSNAEADRVFVEAFHSQAYIEAQHRLSSALADQRRTEIKFVELFARFGHFPTRSALDDVSREVSDLRRRVRRLERANRSASPERRKAEAVDEC